MVQPLWKTVEGPQKVKNRAAPDPAIALLGIYPKDTDVMKRRAICTPMFIAALSTIPKLWRAKNLFNRRMDKEDVVHIYNELLLSHQKG